jgi:hypothetical protein
MTELDIVIAGSPSTTEAAAVRAAIEQLVSQDLARNSAGAGANPWVLSARIESTRRDHDATRSRARNAWRSSGRLIAATSDLQIGRGDAR